MKSRVSQTDDSGSVLTSGAGLKQKYRAAPPEGKMKGRATKGKG